jgi:predicted lipoprotein
MRQARNTANAQAGQRALDLCGQAHRQGHRGRYRLARGNYLDVDADGDGKADAKVQIGPAVRGTALRDTLEFVNFNEFKNQIEWAQFGKAFNEKINTACWLRCRATA